MVESEAPDGALLELLGSGHGSLDAAAPTKKQGRPARAIVTPWIFHDRMALEAV